MALSYDLDSHLKELELVLHDYTEWFLQVTRRLFYPETDHGDTVDGLVCPDSFGNWVKAANTNASLQPAEVVSLQNLHKDLCARAELLMQEALKSRNPPRYEDFNKLSILFEEFIGKIRRVEKDSLLGDSGIDTLTGLRSKDVMEKDIKREMDRLGRQGKTFALALIRIDHFDVMRVSMKEEEVNAVVILIADFIKKSMRSFDDAYRLDDGVFVLSLKQTGNSGGTRALKRLKAELDKSGATYMHGRDKKLVSLSSCIGEPAEGEDLNAFIKNLERDLDNYVGETGGGIVEYVELSPLQRYIREQN